MSISIWSNKRIRVFPDFVSRKIGKVARSIIARQVRCKAVMSTPMWANIYARSTMSYGWIQRGYFGVVCFTSDFPSQNTKYWNIFTPKTLFSELKLLCISACVKIASTFSEINIMSDILQPLTPSGGARNDPDILTISHKEELLLLALYHKELYGLQIQQAISDSSGGLRQFRIGSLYPMLHSLETKGYVHSRWGDEQHHERGGARRRYYQLTETGSAAVEFIQAFHRNLINWESGKA